MEKYINADKIITAVINEPHKQSSEHWDISPSHDWQLVLIVGYTEEGYPIKEIVERKTLEELRIILGKVQQKLNLITL